MINIKVIKTEQELTQIIGREKFVDFLHTHLDQFRDPKDQIEKSIDYAFSASEGKGGFLLAAFYEKKLAGTLIMNRTGMEGYIPENILVYIAVDASLRGKGIGRSIIEQSFKEANGSIKLHVEYDNPAKRLYERLGFTSKYAEMRYPNT
jgi:GNAT superfamily N-acetyltransferase